MSVCEALDEQVSYGVGRKTCKPTAAVQRFQMMLCVSQPTKCQPLEGHNALSLYTKTQVIPMV